MTVFLFLALWKRLQGKEKPSQLSPVNQYSIVMHAFSMYISHNKTNISINQIDFNLVIYVIRDSLTDLHKQGEIFSKTLQIIVIP
jgi:hypothetical protein